MVLTPASTALPLRFHCASTALPLRCHCAATALPLHWLKWGKTGNHIFPGGRYFVVLTPRQQPHSAPAAHRLHAPTNIGSFGEKIPVFKPNSPRRLLLRCPPAPLATSRPQPPPAAAKHPPPPPPPAGREPAAPRRLRRQKPLVLATQSARQVACVVVVRRGGDHRAMGAFDALDCGEGGGIAGPTRTRMTRKRTPASSPTAAAAAAAATTTAIARCSTAGGVATMTGGVGGGGQ